MTSERWRSRFSPAEVREKTELISALLSIGSLCEDCDTKLFSVVWTGKRHRARIYHVPYCPDLRSAWSRRACEDRLRDLIHRAGMHQADYDGDDDLITHQPS